MTHSLSCLDVSFAWPDGDVVFDGLDLVVGPVRSGLVGRNGSGKSTLLRLIAGRLHPQRGTVQVSGELGYLSQDLVLDTALHVDEVLGVAGRRRAIAAIERGDVDESHFHTIGDDWEVEDRALATLGELGLGAVSLDLRVGELSGGEGVLLGLAAELLRRPDVLLLDEPTNNLDLAARRRLYSAVASWRGALLVVSHDRDLLELVDQIGELRDGEVTWYGGNLSAYEEAVAVEQEAAERVVRAAESDVRRQQRDLADAQVKLARRVRYGQKMWNQKREPKVVMGARKRQAQVSAGKHRNLHEERLATARESLADAEARVHQDDDIRVDLPETEVPVGRRVLQLDDVRLRTGQTCALELRGPERVALVGPNGAGKTTLLHTISGDLDPAAGTVAVPVPARLLPQRLDLLDDTLSVVDNVARFAPGADNNTLRARLARFLFRGRDSDQAAATLSGGERFRATLAALLLAEPPPQLLMLDEPTNNLDLASVRQLSQALAAYRGALVVASHDLAFLRTIGITRWLRLDRDGLHEGGLHDDGLHEGDPPA
ncbi:MAG: ATP-binding cassette domain-containing protein [Propionibacteriales bacterium]|nr:ATP-binding cassette domain-containing protein [Propionibacteriales bacterium]